MNYLEALEICLSALEMMQAGKRVQVPRAKLDELKNMLSQIMSIVEEMNRTPELNIAVEGLFNAISAALEINMQVLPDAIKGSIESGLLMVKHEVGEKAFEYFTFHEFEPTPEIIPLMREVVACHYKVEV